MDPDLMSILIWGGLFVASQVIAAVFFPKRDKEPELFTEYDHTRSNE